MKLLYIITKGTWGGAQTYVNALVNDQISRKNDVFVIVGSNGRLTENLNEKLDKNHIFIIDDIKNKIGINLFSAIIKVRNLIKKIRPDIVHVNSTIGGLVGRLADIGMKNKMVYTVHGSTFAEGINPKKAKFAKIMEKSLLPITDKLIFVSKYDYDLWIKNKLIQLNDQRARVIWNGVPDIKKRKKVESNNGEFIITMAARFSLQKNQRLLIQAIAELNDPKIHVFFLGDGTDYLQECKTLVKEYKIENNVHFIGAVDNVTKYYIKSDLVALISNYEGLPISLIEALPLGCPLLASNVGGVSELFNNNGYCDENDVEEIKKHILKMKNDSFLMKKFSDNSRKLYLDRFTESQMLINTNEVYSEEI